MPVLSPWVAGTKPLKCHPSAFEGAVLLYSFQSVGTAGRCKAAPRPQKGGNSSLIEADNTSE